MFLDSFPDLQYFQGAVILTLYGTPQQKAVGYYTAGRCQEDGEATCVIDGRSFTQHQLFLESLLYDDQFARTYNALAHTVAENGYEKVTLPNGQIATPRELCLKAVDLNPDFSDPYRNLRRTMADDEQIQLLNGRVLSKKQVIDESMRCDPAETYYDLGHALNSYYKTISVHGRSFTKTTLFLESLKHDPTYRNPMHFVASSLRIHEETIRFVDGREFDKIGLYNEILRLNPTDSLAYCNLGVIAAGTQAPVLLTDGRTLDCRELFLESLRFKPASIRAYCQLAQNLHQGECVTMADGQSLDRVGLLLRALDYPAAAQGNVRALLRDYLPAHYAWTRRFHALLFATHTNVLFATVLLGLQRLEETGVLALTHHSMLEDMLEGWTWGDNDLI